LAVFDQLVSLLATRNIAGKRMIPAGCKRVSREASRRDILVPSKPMMSS
jgi:hypothetical protein